MTGTAETLTSRVFFFASPFTISPVATIGKAEMVRIAEEATVEEARNAVFGETKAVVVPMANRAKPRELGSNTLILSF